MMLVENPRRSRRRNRRRARRKNVGFGPFTTTYSNRRRRRKHRRNTAHTMFNRRRRRRNVGFGPFTTTYSNRRRRRRGLRRNPAFALGGRSGITGRLTAGFSPKVITDAGLIAAGAFGNAWLRNQVSSRLIPQARTGIPSYLLGLGTSGLMMFVPRVGSKLFVGGVFGEVFRALKENVPQFRALGEYLEVGQVGGGGMSEYLEQGQLSQFPDDTVDVEYSGIGEYLEVGQVGGGSPIEATFE